MAINLEDLSPLMLGDHIMVVVSDKRDNLPTRLGWVQKGIVEMFGDLIVAYTDERVVLRNGSELLFTSYRSELRGFHANTIIVCNRHLMGDKTLHKVIDSLKLGMESVAVKYWRW